MGHCPSCMVGRKDLGDWIDDVSQRVHLANVGSSSIPIMEGSLKKDLLLSGWDIMIKGCMMIAVQ